jgi:phosphoglycerol transferase MdoB-like AlkP superfamily enzyme
MLTNHHPNSRSEALKLGKSFVALYAFWLLFFGVNRFFFILYNHEEWSTIPLGEVCYSFVSGFLLDLSMASYFITFSFLCYLFYASTKMRLFMNIQEGLVYLFVILGEMIYLTEYPIYDEWHTKLSRKAILYLQHPTEVYNSATTKELIGGTLGILFLSTAFVYVYRKWFRWKSHLTYINWKTPVVGFLAFPVILVLGIRGGIQQIPIQQSNAYYSKSNFLNLAAVNSIWNLGQSFIENRYDEGTNPYVLYSADEARAIVKQLFNVEKDTFPIVLNNPKPNVVFVIMESLSADMMKSLGGYDSIAPNLQMIADSGILFTHLFSSGTLSDQGHCSLLSGFPSQPSVVIMRQPDKFQKLPSIVTHFKKNGYYTAYYFGGQLEYGNIKGYIYFNQYDRIIEGKDFDPALPKGKLGYHDEFLFERVIRETKEMKQPFFVTAFTMSSHSPYDYPGEQKYFSWGGDENMYLNGVHYSDQSIGKFMSEARKQSWFKNTLFVFCSDHSHATPKQHNFYSPENRQIIGFLYGDVIKPEFRGMKVPTVGNHHDLPNTLLNQLGGDVKPFVWSKNLLNPNTQNFGFSADEYMNYFYDQQNAYVYQYKNKEFLFKRFVSPTDSARMVRNGSAYMQVLYDEYLKY